MYPMKNKTTRKRLRRYLLIPTQTIKRFQHLVHVARCHKCRFRATGTLPYYLTPQFVEKIHHLIDHIKTCKFRCQECKPSFRYFQLLALHKLRFGNCQCFGCIRWKFMYRSYKLHHHPITSS